MYNFINVAIIFLFGLCLPFYDKGVLIIIFPWEHVFGSRIIFFYATMDYIFLLFHCNNTYYKVITLQILITFEDCTDTVRGLAVMSDLGILSASHDGWVHFCISYSRFN
jgi:hypothetical protein